VRSATGPATEAWTPRFWPQPPRRHGEHTAVARYLVRHPERCHAWFAWPEGRSWRPSGRPTPPSGPSAERPNSQGVRFNSAVPVSRSRGLRRGRVR
jgi:hypothetical protein